MKIIEAQQVNMCNSCKNTKPKLLKTDAAMWFSKMCRIKHLKLNYINIRISGKKPQDKNTTSNALRYRISQEIKFLYCKKKKKPKPAFVP